ncbi:hypothetical protein DFH06DRAFT_1467869 [Mycena polygramma]|nr:hypothetical protein DFH06DRAFT_1467869 [Mycena polygramma]
MQEPKSGAECDFPMCPLQDYDDEPEIPPTLMRCSTCKNRFYCSTSCQKKDWNEHKWNCSVFPGADGLPPATVIEIDDGFKTEVRRVVAILKEVAEVLKDDKKKLTASMLAPLLQITSELPDRLRYARAVEGSDQFKYRLPIVTACRLLLVDYVATLDDAGRERYTEFFAGMRLPTSWCEMYGPKIVGRPADLSPGEYAMLAQTMMIWVFSEMERTKEEEKEPGRMEENGEEKYSQGEKKKNEGEGEVENPWVWLAVVLKKVYSVKSAK